MGWQRGVKNYHRGTGFREVPSLQEDMSGVAEGSQKLSQSNSQPRSWMAKGIGREEKLHSPILLLK